MSVIKCLKCKGLNDLVWCIFAMKNCLNLDSILKTYEEPLTDILPACKPRGTYPKIISVDCSSLTDRTRVFQEYHCPCKFVGLYK